MSVLAHFSKLYQKRQLRLGFGQLIEAVDPAQQQLAREKIFQALEHVDPRCDIAFPKGSPLKICGGEPMYLAILLADLPLMQGLVDRGIEPSGGEFYQWVICFGESDVEKNVAMLDVGRVLAQHPQSAEGRFDATIAVGSSGGELLKALVDLHSSKQEQALQLMVDYNLRSDLLEKWMDSINISLLILQGFSKVPQQYQKDFRQLIEKCQENKGMQQAQDDKELILSQLPDRPKSAGRVM